MSEIERMEVYAYVKSKSSKYLDTIIRALIDGIKEENRSLKEKKSMVEGGLVSLFRALPAKKLRKLKPNIREVLKEALLNCTFFLFKNEIKKLEETSK